MKIVSGLSSSRVHLSSNDSVFSHRHRQMTLTLDCGICFCCTNVSARGLGLAYLVWLPLPGGGQCLTHIKHWLNKWTKEGRKEGTHFIAPRKLTSQTFICFQEKSQKQRDFL